MQLSASKIDSKRWPRKGLVKAQMNILQIVPKVGSVCPVSGPKQYTLDNSKVHVYFPQLCRGTSNRCTSSQPLSWIVIATVCGGSFSSELTLRDRQPGNIWSRFFSVSSCSFQRWVLLPLPSLLNPNSWKDQLNPTSASSNSTQRVNYTTPFHSTIAVAEEEMPKAHALVAWGKELCAHLPSRTPAHDFCFSCFCFVVQGLHPRRDRNTRISFIWLIFLPLSSSVSCWHSWVLVVRAAVWISVSRLLTKVTELK